MTEKLYSFMVALLAAGFLVVLTADIADARRSECHHWHSCPSDRGTYICSDLGYDTFCPKPAPSQQPAKWPSVMNRSVSLPSQTPSAGTDHKIKVARAQATVIRAQALLRTLGYDPGPVDGVVGKRTRSAIMMFQAEQGIRIDGEVTDDLIRRLTRAVAAKPLPEVETRDAVPPATNPVQLTPANGPAVDAAEAIAAPPGVVVGGEGPALAAVPDVAAEPPAQAWRIQIASMRTPEAAEQAWARVQAKHKDLLGALSLDIRKATIEGRGTFYRVRAGPLDGRQAAAALCSTLKARKQGCLVVQP